MHLCLNRGTAGGSVPLEQFVELSAEARFPGCDVDMAFGVERGARALADLFVRNRQRFGGWGVPFDWRGDQTGQTDGLKLLSRCATIAGELGIDSCATWVMPSSERPFMENWEFHRVRLEPVAKALAEHGLQLGLEFVAPYHLRRHFPHEFIFTPGLMLELCDAVGQNVGLLVDSFHCHAAGTTWEHLAAMPSEKIVMVHVNDAPDVPVSQLRDDQRLLPGAGVIDLAGFIEALKAAGYGGPVSLEVFNAELREMPASEAASRARRACESLLQDLENK